MGLIEATSDGAKAADYHQEVVFALAEPAALKGVSLPGARLVAVPSGLVGLVCPADSPYANCEERPDLQLKGPAVFLDPGPGILADQPPNAVMAGLAGQAARLLKEAVQCHEYRIALFAPSAGNSNVREAVRIAHRLGDLAERTCYTPPPLRPGGEGELLLSASLVVHDAATARFRAKLQGMVHFARAAGLRLVRSGPHFLQSVTLSHDPSAEQALRPMRQQG